LIDLKQYQKRVAQLYNDERKWWRGVLEKQATKADILIDAHRGKLFAGVKHLLDTGLLEKAFIFVADKRESGSTWWRKGRLRDCHESSKCARPVVVGHPPR